MGVPQNMRSYKTYCERKDLHGTSHSRWNSLAFSRALVGLVARYWLIFGAILVSKPAWVGNAINLFLPRSWMISTIRGYTGWLNKVCPA